ncbi:MAG: UDP-N-acetylmuramate dehydrogenase [Chloroflexi bacterium]|jgi:UDP-N-acetylmuramate dehydrogenase|nr:UDP-N-acetylmuramate dehydrogenase [Chloroflexota bacterium]
MMEKTRLQALQNAFGERLQKDVPLARYTAARVGGPADWLLEVHSVDELAQAVSLLWREDVPFIVLGGGSNVLVSDAGVREVVIHNRARTVHFDEKGEYPVVWADSGANLGLVARKAAARGLSGLEWAAGIPGTVGGAVAGNAGAHGGDMAGNLVLAEILHRMGTEEPVREMMTASRLEMTYRSSLIKRNPGAAVVLGASLRLEKSTPEAVQAKSDEFVAYRRRTQPPGASMGSMFKNPPGDFAGRLIEAAGLKGARVGEAEISTLHANFFINHGQAKAADILALINMAREAVFEKFRVPLALEIELLGEW